MPTRRYTEEQFRTALRDPQVRTMADLCRALGLVPRGANYETLRRYGARLEVQLPTTEHLPDGFVDRLSDDTSFTEAVAASESIAQVIRRFGGRPTSSSYRRVRRRIAELGLDTSHHRGKGYSAGRTYPERWKPIEDVLRETTSTVQIRGALLRSKTREHRCEQCRRGEWEGRPIPLELDHIDGDRTNNALGNLRLICPNCHALTPTYRGRNIGRYGPRPKDDGSTRSPDRDADAIAIAPTLPSRPG